ncbi:protein kinase domain-containing protein [Allohahella marinimesophila]|uniref:Protein kinase domain-containing protein n=1 Tax=Allohahella marinimesophila TaxID=1054972 RepID=A0ABP7PD42_9GAMM
MQGYKRLSKLGEGGMATVYRGVQESLQRPVAIKVLAANLADEPEVLQRFEAESMIIAQLNHPHIIHVIDKGLTPEGRPFFVMEFVEGMTLEDAINRDKLDSAKKLEVLVQVCKALSYAHKNGVIHRDIKPANVLLDKDWEVRIADFGIAHFFTDTLAQTRPGASSRSSSADTSLTMGTSAYMAPELMMAGQASERSDLYALGVMMYELFTGIVPAPDAPAAHDVMPAIELGLSELIASCMAEEIEDRPMSADDVHRDLLYLSQGQHLSPRQRVDADRNIRALTDTYPDSHFSVLDVLKDEPATAVFLYEDQTREVMYIVKRLSLQSAGLREHKILARHSHPNIVTIHGVSHHGDKASIIMAYMASGTLADHIGSKVVPAKAFEWGAAIAQGLKFAHQHKVFHGNLRAKSIFMDDETVLKLSGFGIPGPEAAIASDQSRGRSDAVAAQTDLKAVGTILWQALAGAPLQAETSMKGAPPAGKTSQTVRTLTTARGRAPALPEGIASLPESLKRVLDRLLSDDPREAYPSIEAAAIDLTTANKEARLLEKQVKVDAIKREAAKVARKTERLGRVRSRQKFILPALVLCLVGAAALLEMDRGYFSQEALPVAEHYLEELQSSEVWRQYIAPLL